MISVDYGLAPEHRFPRALNDVLDTYRWLCSAPQPGEPEDGLMRPYSPQQIVLIGDSAGGNLVTAAMVAIARERLLAEQHPEETRCLEQPAGAVLFSPWLDLCDRSEWLKKNADVDPMLPGELMTDAARLYADPDMFADGLVSPLHAKDEELAQFPPLLLQVGTREILFQDAQKFLRRFASMKRIDVQLSIWSNQCHVFQYFSSVLPEGRRALEEAALFVQNRWSMSRCLLAPTPSAMAGQLSEAQIASTRAAAASLPELPSQFAVQVAIETQALEAKSLAAAASATVLSSSSAMEPLESPPSVASSSPAPGDLVSQQSQPLSEEQKSQIKSSTAHALEDVTSPPSSLSTEDMVNKMIIMHEPEPIEAAPSAATVATVTAVGLVSLIAAEMASGSELSPSSSAADIDHSQQAPPSEAKQQRPGNWWVQTMPDWLQFGAKKPVNNTPLPVAAPVVAAAPPPPSSSSSTSDKRKKSLLVSSSSELPVRLPPNVDFSSSIKSKVDLQMINALTPSMLYRCESMLCLSLAMQETEKISELSIRDEHFSS